MHNGQPSINQKPGKMKMQTLFQLNAALFWTPRDVTELAATLFGSFDKLVLGLAVLINWALCKAQARGYRQNQLGATWLICLFTLAPYISAKAEARRTRSARVLLVC